MILPIELLVKAALGVRPEENLLTAAGRCKPFVHSAYIAWVLTIYRIPGSTQTTGDLRL